MNSNKKGNSRNHNVYENDPTRKSTSTKKYDLETESRFINKNLTTLGRIFCILSNRKLQTKNAPPYRECKLTRLLQNSLQYENCKTLMIANICQSKINA